MILERSIFVGVTIVALLLIFAIPKEKYRLALIAFSVMQFITTILGHVAVQTGALIYPVHEFAKVNQTSFVYEFLAFPMMCAIFNVYYPVQQSRLWQIGYYILFCTVLTVAEVFIERYTNLIHYIKWNWFWTWGLIFVTLFITRVICVVFFRTIRLDHENRI